MGDRAGTMVGGFEKGSFFRLVFRLRFWNAFGTDLERFWDLILGVFLCFVASHFRKGNSIDCPPTFDVFCVTFAVLLMNSRFAHPPRKTFKFDDPSDEFACFYPSGKLELSRFSSSSLHHSCIDSESVSASIWAPFWDVFWHPFSIFSDTFFLLISRCFLNDF